MTAQAAGHGEHGRDDRATRPGQVTATVGPGRVQAERLLDRRHAALAHAHGPRPGVGRQAVDVVELEPGVGHGGQAGVHRQREGIPHQAPPDRRATDAREHGPVLEPVGRPRGPGRRALRLGDALGRVVAAGRLEQREPDVLVLLEADLDLLADVDLVGLAADDVGREVDARVLGQGHVGDRVRRFEVREPLVLVDGEGHDGRGAGDLGGRPRPAAAHGADGDRGVDHRLAVVAPLDAQAPVGARGPEPLVGRGELGQGAHGDSRVRGGGRPRRWPESRRSRASRGLR